MILTNLPRTGAVKMLKYALFFINLMPNKKGQSWKKDSEMIGFIQFNTGYSKEKKNKLISKIEKRMLVEENLELRPDKKRGWTGYYD